MTSKRTSLLVITFIVVFFCILVVSDILSSHIKMNDESVLGNTAGNLNNNGLYCEFDGKVYFSNAYDSGTLYSMNIEETDIKKLSNFKVKYINAAGKYLYFYQTNSTTDSGLSNIRQVHGMFRSNLKGKKSLCLTQDASLIMNLVGNYIYYQHYGKQDAVTLKKIKIDKSEDIPITNYVANPASCQDGIIYFNGTQNDHNLYALDTRTDQISTVMESNLWNPVVQGDYVYYMDVENNYRLCRSSLSTQEVEVLSQDRLEFFNLYDNIIYYQTNSATEPALKRIQTDGSNDEIVASGIYRDVNITSQAVYFTPFVSEVPVYRTSTFGAVQVTTFDAAGTAALNPE